MSLIELKLIEELFSPARKHEIVGKLKDAMVALRYEDRHRLGGQKKKSAETKTQ